MNGFKTIATLCGTIGIILLVLAMIFDWDLPIYKVALCLAVVFYFFGNNGKSDKK